MPTDDNKKCPLCENRVEPHKKGMLKSWLSDFGESVFSWVSHRPHSKGHTVIITKRHVEDLRGLTSQEWADILPVLKDSIAKIEKIYPPLGHVISMPTGAKATQDQPPHFYVRLDNKNKKDWDYVAIPPDAKYEPAPELPERTKQIVSALQPNRDGIIAEKSKIVAKLLDEKDTVTFTRERLTKVITVSTKAKLANDISAMDAETWAEIGQMLKELMAKIEVKTDCHDFSVDILFGKEAFKLWKEEAKLPVNNGFPESEVIARIHPRYNDPEISKWWWQKNRHNKDQQLGSFENERIALKLRDPEGYAKEWGEKSTPSVRGHKRHLWKQPITYLLMASGAVIALLVTGIYWLLSKKKTKVKSK